MKALTLSLALAAGCAPETRLSALPDGEAGMAAWRAARAEVAALRERFSRQEPYSMNVSLELTQAQLGKRMTARGAVAVRPPHALRMILLGPGGTTALDLWICRDRFRFAVPAIDLERRGDATTPPEQSRGLPVDFLRWWFLKPFGGRLLSFVEEPSRKRYVLRDDGQVIHLLAADRDGPLEARRVSVSDVESLAVRGDVCGQVGYQQQSTGVDIEVRCEKINEQTPPARAFADPDDPSRSCEEAT